MMGGVADFRGGKVAWKWTGMDGEEGSAGPRQMVAVRLRCGAPRGREGGREEGKGVSFP